jgi:hypothetical protein
MRVFKGITLGLIAIAAGALLLAAIHSSGTSHEQAQVGGHTVAIHDAAPLTAVTKHAPSRGREGHGNQGLSAEISVPAWAKNKPVHFYAEQAVKQGATARGGETSSENAIAGASSVVCKSNACLGQGNYAPPNQYGYWSGPLKYHNGLVQHNPEIHVIFWGSNWNNKPGVREKILDLYRWMNGSSYAQAMTQNFDNSGPASATFSMSSMTDTRVAHPTNIGGAAVRQEWIEEKNMNGWGPSDWNDQYVVITAPGTTYSKEFVGEFCGYHENWNSTTTTFIPWQGEEPFYQGCNRQPEVWENMSITTSHEYAESVTNPQVFTEGEGWGWWNYEHEENADICQEETAEPAPGVIVNPLWDNYLYQCVLSDVNPPRLATQTYAPTSSEADHTMTLHGAVNPAEATGNHWDAYYYFLVEGAGESPHAVPATGRSTGYGGVFSPVDENAGFVKGNTSYTVSLWANDQAQWSEVPGGKINYTTPDWRPAVNPGTVEIGPGNKAKFHATIDPQGYETTYHYQWGKTTSYELGIFPYPKDASVGSGTEPVAIEGEMPLLSAETTYHYRIVATNAEGTTYSPDQTFTTPDTPYARFNETTNVGATSALLHGEINPHGAETKYHFEYGTEWEPEGLKYKTPEQTIPAGYSYVPVSAAISGLSPFTHYELYLVATNAWSKGTASSGFTTFDPPPIATTGGASEVTGYGAKLSGTVNPEGLPTKYNFQYGTSIPGMLHSEEQKLAAGTETVGISQTIHGLAPSTTYYYRLWATNPAGSSGEYKTFTTTDGKPKVSVQAPSGIKAGQATFNAKVLSNGYATHFHVEWGPTASYGNSTPVELVGGEPGETPVSQAIFGLKDQTTYHYRLLVDNAYGTDASTDQTFTTPLWRPAIGYQTPIGITAKEATLTAGINPDGLATGYRFEWGPTTSYGNSVPVPDKEIGSGESEVKASQAISGLKPATKYHFRTVATNAEGTTYGSDQTFTTGALLHWFACKEQSGGHYLTSKCSTELASGKWELLKLKEAEKTTITAKGNPIAYSFTSAGISGTLNCETEVTSTSLENPSGGGNGVGSATFKLKGCKAEGGFSGCKVTLGEAVAEKLEASTIEGKAQVAITPKEGTTIATITLAECAAAGNASLTGTLRGLYSNAESKIEYNAEASGESLRIGNPVAGPKVTPVGSIGLEASGGGYVQALGQPVVKTEAATSVKASEATLNGTVNPEGASTRYQFEYGKTTSYGQSVPVEAKDAGEGLTDVKVAETLKGLVAGTLYHFRLTATNGINTVNGLDKTFTTTAAPLHWFACTKQAGGKYTSGKCSTEGSPKEWESVILKEAEKTTITAKGNPIAYSFSSGGVSQTLSCETEVTGTSLENPSGGGNGVGSATFKLKGCKAEGGFSGCKVTLGEAVAEKLEASTIEGKTYVLITPKEGTTVASFTLAECAAAATYKLVGALQGLYSNSESKIEYNAEASGDALRIGSIAGPKVTPVGSIGLETTSGGYLRAE